MRSEKKTNAYLGLIAGFVIQYIGGIFSRISESGAILGIVVSIIGAAIFVWACMNYAESKGYSKWFGLFGILSCIGLVVLILLPEKRRRRR
jgi:mannose/fructose/N-acetylgalactosamine-specific phosphotransferase system component IID